LEHGNAYQNKHKITTNNYFSMSKNIALIELTTSHEECIYSQVKFLKDADYCITLVIHPKLRNQISSYELLIDHLEIYNFDSSNSFLKNIQQFAKLYKFLVRENFKKVIFNTASSRKEIILLTYLLSKKGVKCYGTIHNLKKLNHSFSQKLISQNIKKYFVINDFLLDVIPTKDQTISFESYYPIFFPTHEIQKLKACKEDLWICIPGELDYKRRDYDLLIDVAQNINDGRVKFIILGKANKTKEEVIQFFTRIEELKLKENFILFDSFIENEKFHSFIANSDYIMSPVDIKTDSYLKYKITGAYNLAFSYRKPLLSHIKFKVISDLEENSIFYNDKADLEKIINDLLEDRLLKKSIYKNPKWDYTFQKDNYLKHIN
jgi:hypothetical protein